MLKAWGHYLVFFGLLFDVYVYTIVDARRCSDKRDSEMTCLVGSVK
jgi:hypothetical protein